MNELLKYYYNIIPNDMNIYDNVSFFYYDNVLYLFCLISCGEKQLLENLKYNININYYKIIKTIFDEYIVEFEGSKYVLFSISSDYNESVSLFDIVDFSNKYIINKTIKLDCSDVWAKKIDYLDYKIKCMTINDNVFVDLFTYFKYIAEVGIQYFKSFYHDILINNLSCTVSHRRIYSPNYKINYYNPLIFIIDYRVRDYSEYFKSEIFMGDVSIDILKNEFVSLISYSALTVLELKMIISRFLFVSIFFDIVEELIDGKIKNNDLILYEKKVKNYEEFLTFLSSFVNDFSL